LTKKREKWVTGPQRRGGVGEKTMGSHFDVGKLKKRGKVGNSQTTGKPRWVAIKSPSEEARSIKR